MRVHPGPLLLLFYRPTRKLPQCSLARALQESKYWNDGLFHYFFFLCRSHERNERGWVKNRSPSAHVTVFHFLLSVQMDTMNKRTPRQSLSALTVLCGTVLLNWLNVIAPVTTSDFSQSTEMCASTCSLCMCVCVCVCVCVCSVRTLCLISLS